MNQFYELVTGDRTAFKKLCEQLPNVIDDIVSELTPVPICNTVFDELRAISPNLLKSLYLLSFEKYEGFSDFHV